MSSPRLANTSSSNHVILRSLTPLRPFPSSTRSSALHTLLSRTGAEVAREYFPDSILGVSADLVSGHYDPGHFIQRKNSSPEQRREDVRRGVVMREENGSLVERGTVPGRLASFPGAWAAPRRLLRLARRGREEPAPLPSDGEPSERLF